MKKVLRSKSAWAKAGRVVVAGSIPVDQGHFVNPDGIIIKFDRYTYSQTAPAPVMSPQDYFAHGSSPAVETSDR